VKHTCFIPTKKKIICIWFWNTELNCKIWMYLKTI